MSLLVLLNGPSITYTYARPASDVSAGGWTTDTGSTTNLYAAIDEAVTNDADYIQSATTPSDDTAEVALQTLSATVAGTLTLVIRAYKV